MQNYNWGLALNESIGLQSDKLEMLMMFYCRKAEGRIIVTEFELIVRLHTSFRFFDKRNRIGIMRDLRTDWKGYVARKAGIPPSVR